MKLWKTKTKHQKLPVYFRKSSLYMSLYCRRWLLSACAYDSWHYENMRLTADMHLTRNGRLIRGWEIVGGAFAASVKLFVQHGRASSMYFGEPQLWPSHLQAHLAATCWRDTNLGMGGGQQPRQIRCQSPQECYCLLACSSRVFTGVLALPQARRDHHLWSYTDRRKRGKATSQR